MNGNFSSALVLGLAAAGWFGTAAAQEAGTGASFGGLRHDATLPVEIGADSLSISQADGIATFTGNVIVVQGTLRLSAGEITVRYAEGGGAGGQVDSMTATGGVTLTNGAESAESQTAVYAVAAGEVTMDGDVILTQGDSAIAGQKLVIALDTGTARMEGRVRTVLQPQAGQ
jgi:lipopolysaccharide export system protein LptA